MERRDDELERFFARDPLMLPIYRVLEDRILAEIGADVLVRVQKTQITFSDRRVFGCASLPIQRKRDGALPQPVDAPCARRAPGRDRRRAHGLDAGGARLRAEQGRRRQIIRVISAERPRSPQTPPRSFLEGTCRHSQRTP